VILTAGRLAPTGAFAAFLYFQKAASSFFKKKNRKPLFVENFMPPARAGAIFPRRVAKSGYYFNIATMRPAFQ